MGKISHEPKQYLRLAKTDAISLPNFKLFKGSIYGRYSENNKPVLWVCDNYTIIEGKLPVHIYDGKNWYLRLVPQSHTCYKAVKAMILSLGYVPKVFTDHVSFSNCENMMKTYSRHKKGVGSRINTHQINNPLQWKEGTEAAHWNGGSASFVASNIK